MLFIHSKMQHTDQTKLFTLAIIYLFQKKNTKTFTNVIWTPAYTKSSTRDCPWTKHQSSNHRQLILLNTFQIITKGTFPFSAQGVSLHTFILLFHSLVTVLHEQLFYHGESYLDLFFAKSPFFYFLKSYFCTLQHF